MAEKFRLDQLLVTRGLAPSRERAQALILAGAVMVGEQKALKPGQRFAAEVEVRTLGEQPAFASRAGEKLAAALDHFGIAVTGRTALDVGSSTGGFTDCLLQRGARRVVAVDCGTNQMIWRLRTDARVTLLERTNARWLTPAQVDEPIEVMTVDVSFISVTLLLSALTPLLAAGADAIVLVKPQFEAGREAVGRGGIVREEAARRAAVARVEAALAAHGFTGLEAIPSPVLGAHGNQEYLVRARRQ